MIATQTAVRVGPLLRDWRQRRRLSQLELALTAGTSARHVSFIETGRAQPSSDMVLRLAEHLDVPARQRNALLIAAGHAPVYQETPLDAPEMTAAREAVDKILAGHEPYPALVTDGAWNLIAANNGMGKLLASVAPELVAPPANVLRIALHPDGMAPRIVNLGEWRAHLLDRLRRQCQASGSETLAALYDEALGYGGEHEGPEHNSASDLVLPMRLRHGDLELSFFSTVATFGTPMDITLTELAIETFFPADEQTREFLHS
ncbi:helix-turn-helix domain-containing protein [Solihabitans fulvus]|uniref:Helix-turn-helix domain-containing protein n=1 Tax=Solihabitans fulvus TaxID=1892852 RepID=A0A5B2XC95_9PSEU|nr:helix-turn-helix transcriptional regulator [Solihabitans fulvus]KAA2261338.1 helix-turn-helix domain-containing protein [Solihabitans fulvus]